MSVFTLLDDILSKEKDVLERLKANFGIQDALYYLEKLCRTRPEFCGSGREALETACGQTSLTKDQCKGVVDQVMKKFCGENKSSAACKNEAINKPPAPPPPAPAAPIAPAPIVAITEAAKEATTKGGMNMMLIGGIIAIVLVLIIVK